MLSLIVVSEDGHECAFKIRSTLKMERIIQSHKERYAIGGIVKLFYQGEELSPHQSAEAAGIPDKAILYAVRQTKFQKPKEGLMFCVKTPFDDYEECYFDLEQDAPFSNIK